MNDKPMNAWGTYEEAPLDRFLPNATATVPHTTDELIAHECAHAVVGHRLGMPLEVIDMTGLLVPMPYCVLDECALPPEERARAVGIMALAGPVGECLKLARQPQWRQDGEVARAQARVIAPDNVIQQARLLVLWARHAQTMLEMEPAYIPLQRALKAKHTLLREEFERIVREADQHLTMTHA